MEERNKKGSRNDSNRQRRKAYKKKHRRGVVKKTVKWILLAILMAVAAFFVILFIRLFPAYRSYTAEANEILLNIDEDSFKRSGNTRVYDADGELIGELGNERYEYVSLNDVSDYVVYAYVANEDRKFFEHSGVDWKATARAALELVKNRGEITQGGSTITQQVVKNNILSQERTYERKILEITIALRLERVYSKNDIMEFYVNSCYYGEGCYGVEGAAQYYFAKDAADVTLAEAAVLAVSSMSPSAHNPVSDYDYILEKKDRVINEMQELGYVTKEEADEARAESPEIVQNSEHGDTDNYMLTYAVHDAAEELMRISGFDFKYTFGTSDEYDAYTSAYSTAYTAASEDVRDGGYKIYTSFDQDAQDALQDAVDSGLSDFTEKTDSGQYLVQGAAVCIDNETGHVVAAVGGRDDGGSYNRAYQAKRQPGSAIKPLVVYAPALDNGVAYPDSVYTDAQFDDNGYSPKNAGDRYYGDVTVREAVGRSLNTVALRVFLDTGNLTALSYLDALHFSTLAYADSTMDGIALGGFTNGVTVSDMAQGYYCLASGGECHEASCLLSLETNSGDVLYGYPDAETISAYSADAAFIMTDMLEGTLRESYGTGKSAYNSSYIAAGKTGTTNSSKDGWFCGYSAYYTCAVWVGYDSPREINGLSGGTYPAGIWSSFMDGMHEGLAKKDFACPNTVYLANSSGKTEDVDRTSGDVYAARPAGYEYRSSRLDEAALAKAAERAERKAQDTALAAVEDLETFVITSYEDVLAFDGMYNSVLELIDAVTDLETRAYLLDRVGKAYEALTDEIREAWADAYELAEEAAEAEREAEREIAAAESLAASDSAAQDAVNRAESAKKSVVEWYVSYLNKAQYYTDAVRQMISDAKNALSECIAYGWYESERTRLQSAIDRAQKLPTEPETYASPSISDYQDGMNKW